ncbi:MAG: hypothetical protein HYY45_04355 [Deltaproteobacteria bacterium]|nr:hypothetical protein [Deltaproteobacteria bacterium]
MSLILLDWSVRESFHLLDYLRRQSVDRDQFEVVFIEYYSRIAEALKPFADQVDTWALLEMPESCVYHKHLMYNCGLVFAHGEIVVLCDSDAMVRESFIRTIADEFEREHKIVLHLDQFRNLRKDFYPFNYPSFEEVLGEGCINNIDGATAGILERLDPLHSRNYGACMCARRADLIALGGADEHIDYLGHVCGPYEMTFRLINCGFKETWHEAEFLYHTWHPGQSGVDNYQGPHDGKQMSSTALEALVTKRTRPLVENRAIRCLRAGEELGGEWIGTHLIEESYRRDWDRDIVTERQARERKSGKKAITDLYRAHKITNDDGRFYAWRSTDAKPQASGDSSSRILEGGTVQDLVEKIDEAYPAFLRLSERVTAFHSLVSLGLWPLAVPIKALVRAVREKVGQENQGPRAAPAFRPPTEPSMAARLRRLWQQCKLAWLATKYRQAYVNRWENEMIAGLYFTRNGAPWDAPGKKLLIITSPYLHWYLKALMVLGFLPAIRIKRLKGRHEIEAYFGELARRKEPESLILARNIFTDFHGLIRSCPGFKNLIVF